MKKHRKDDTIVLEVFDDLGAATSAQAKLKEQGIDSFIHDGDVMGLDPIAGIELTIFIKDKERAKKTLSIHRSS